MRIDVLLNSKTKHAAACVALVASTPVVWAQGVPVEDDQLAEVYGQAMFTVDNTGSGGFDMTKITLNADVKLNADFSKINWGTKTDGTTSATSTDLSIDKWSFVRLEKNLADPTHATDPYLPYVSIKDPYIQFVYKNQSDAAQREIVGLRMGFGQIDGEMGLALSALRGNMVLSKETTDTTGPDAGTLTLNATGASVNTFNCTGTAGGCSSGAIPMASVGQIKATASKDFFISLLSESVSFAEGTVPSGVAINWTQGLTYQNIGGGILANPLPALAKRQGG